MDRYAFAYKVGSTPWERHATATRTSTAAILDREEAARSRPLGRAIDVGCGRGLYTCELATRGWQAVGIDFVPRAINAASRRGDCGASFVVGDVTDLESGDLGTFDLFLDIGCFQGLRPEQQLAEGRGVSALANPGATLLVLAFQPTRMQHRHRWGVEDGWRNRSPWLGDPLGRARQHRRVGVAVDKDSTPVVPAPGVGPGVTRGGR